MENYYDVLEIERTADERAIKKAYAKMVRKYPPEKCEDEFKKIREAYETLINPVTRDTYDKMLDYGDEINDLFDSGRQAMNDEDYEKAIQEFKKILVISPTQPVARNLLGLAYLYNLQYDAAISQFERLIRDHDNNATYYFNLAIAYKRKGYYQKSEEMFKRAVELDRLNVDIVLEFSDLYLKHQKYNEAIQVLQQAIDYDGSIDFQDFIYLFEMVQIYIIAGDMNACEAVIDKIEEILSDEDNEKKYAAWRFAKLAYQLYDLKAYELASRIAHRALEFDPDNEGLEKMCNELKRINHLFQLYDKLVKDDYIPAPIKGPIIFYMSSDSLDKEELEEKRKANLNAIDSYIKNAYSEVITSINRIKNNYRELYEANSEIYDKILELAKNEKKINDEWNELYNDTAIISPYKRLIALWLSEDISKTERESYFDDIISELANYSATDALKPIRRLKSTYPTLYKLNPDYLDKLEKALENTLYSHSYDSDTYDSSTYSSNSSSSSSSYSSSRQYSSSSSCFVATAAFGTPWAKEIDILRRWRDEVLSKSFPGRLFIRFYYKVGPYAAIVVEKSDFLKCMVRKVIYHIISIIRRQA